MTRRPYTDDNIETGWEYDLDTPIATEDWQEFLEDMLKLPGGGIALCGDKAWIICPKSERKFRVPIEHKPFPW